MKRRHLNCSSRRESPAYSFDPPPRQESPGYSGDFLRGPKSPVRDEDDGALYGFSDKRSYDDGSNGGASHAEYEYRHLAEADRDPDVPDHPTVSTDDDAFTGTDVEDDDIESSNFDANVEYEEKAECGSENVDTSNALAPSPKARAAAKRGGVKREIIGELDRRIAEREARLRDLTRLSSKEHEESLPATSNKADHSLVDVENRLANAQERLEILEKEHRVKQLDCDTIKAETEKERRWLVQAKRTKEAERKVLESLQERIEVAESARRRQRSISSRPVAW